MTRFEKIQFIRENSSKHATTDFSEYDDDDLRRLLFSIPLSEEKRKRRNKTGYWYMDFWGNLLNKCPDFYKPNGKRNFPAAIITLIWIVAFNPVISLLCFTISMMGIIYWIVNHFQLIPSH